MEHREILDGLPIVGDDPAVNFVNTLILSIDKDYLGSGPRAIRWFETLGLLSRPEAERLAEVPETSPVMRQTLAGLHELREVLHGLIYAVAGAKAAEPSLMERFRRLHLDASSHLDLNWNDAEGCFSLEIEADDPRIMLWRMTRHATALVTTAQNGRLRRCGRPECDWVFLDTSKNGRRRWCTPHICGNRMRLRSFLARHRDGNA